MFNNNPLESLAAFAITFAAGVITTVSFSAYVDWVKRRAREA